MEQKNAQAPIQIELTEEQRRQLKDKTGKDVKAIQFSAEELEQRIAPRMFIY